MTIITKNCVEFEKPYSLDALEEIEIAFNKTLIAIRDDYFKFLYHLYEVFEDGSTARFGAIVLSNGELMKGVDIQ